MQVVLTSSQLVLSKKCGAIRVIYWHIFGLYRILGGAVTVLSAFKGAVEQKLPVNLVVAVAFVENLVGSDAYHPSDIIKSYKGITVDIQNTDAEGRLILADAMSYTQEKHKPNTLIELSTLTGAVRIALVLYHRRF